MPDTRGTPGSPRTHIPPTTATPADARRRRARKADTMDTRQILLSMLPAVVTGVLAALAFLAARVILKQRSPWSGAFPAGPVPLLIAAALTVGAYAWQSRVELWAVSTTHRFPALALIAAAAGTLVWIIRRLPHKAAASASATTSTTTSASTGNLAETSQHPFQHVEPPASPLRLAASALVALLAGGAAAWIFLGALPDAFLSPRGRTLWIIALAAAAALQAAVLESVLVRLAGWRGPALLWALVGTIALGLSAGFANAPIVVGAVAATFAPIALAGLLRVQGRGLAPLHGTGTALAIVIVGATTFANWFGAKENWPMLALLLAAPIAAAAALLPALRARPLAALAAAALPAVALAGVQAAIALPPLIEAAGGGGSSAEYDY